MNQLILSMQIRISIEQLIYKILRISKVDRKHWNTSIKVLLLTERQIKFPFTRDSLISGASLNFVKHLVQDRRIFCQ